MTIILLNIIINNRMLIPSARVKARGSGHRGTSEDRFYTPSPPRGWWFVEVVVSILVRSQSPPPYSRFLSRGGIPLWKLSSRFLSRGGISHLREAAVYRISLPRMTIAKPFLVIG